MIANQVSINRFYTKVWIFFALIILACSSDKATADGAHSFKLALLTPGQISDQSWNGGAYDGLIRVHDSLGTKISHIQTKTPAEFNENFRQYGP